MQLMLTRDMVMFVAALRNSGLGWAEIGRQFGVSGARIKAAYLRGSNN